MTAGALTTTSINNSGTLSSGAITCTSTISNGTNSLTTGNITCSSLTNSSSTNPLTITSSTGSTTLGYNTLQLLIPGVAPNSNMYGFGIDKAGAGTIMFGINRNTVSGQVPAFSPYISTYNANQYWTWECWYAK